MSLSDGQSLALHQLREIEQFGPEAFELVSVKEPESRGEFLTVDVSLNCTQMPKADGGLPLRARERITLQIPPDFTFRPPTFWAPHKRFAGFPHVQWCRYLCLYLSTETEWNPSDGIYGAIDRLDDWLRHGARAELNPVGEPLHPPAIYTSAGPQQLVIPEADTPKIEATTWFGFARLDRKAENRVHITDWITLGNPLPEGQVAAAILLHEQMPFEYPTTVKAFITLLTERGVSQQTLFLALKLVALATDEDKPMYLVLGTPMRGIGGGEERHQHLSAWYLEPWLAKGFRLTLTKHPDINEAVEAILMDWAEKAKIHWCDLHEQRPAVTTRRDATAPLSWFRGKTISLWGCGALGSHIAEAITRAGAARIILHDRSTVTPGLLTRQVFDDADIGRPKTDALTDRLTRINPAIAIETRNGDLHRSNLGDGSWAGEADLVIDATASRTIALKLELQRQQSETCVPIVSMAFGHQANRGMVTVIQPDFTGGPFDAERHAKIAVCNQDRHTTFREEFWPDPGSRDLFQPEPGCSHPTFTGSAADVAALTGSLLNIAAQHLKTLKNNAAATEFIALPHLAPPRGQPKRAGFTWSPDLIVPDPHHGYQVRLDPAAQREILAWIRRNARVNGPTIETGGLLFGEFNEPTKIVWITEISGPPPDSQASAQAFICGTDGTHADAAERKSRTKGSVSFIGMWHTHPVSTPMPSTTDLAAMFELLVAAETTPRHTLMLIVGNLRTAPQLGAYVFTRNDFVIIRTTREADADAS